MLIVSNKSHPHLQVNPHRQTMPFDSFHRVVCHWSVNAKKVSRQWLCKLSGRGQCWGDFTAFREIDKSAAGFNDLVERAFFLSDRIHLIASHHSLQEVFWVCFFLFCFVIAECHFINLLCCDGSTLEWRGVWTINSGGRNDENWWICLRSKKNTEAKFLIF